MVGDWELARRLGRVPHPYTETDARFFLDVVVPSEWVWAIVLRTSGELAGMVGLTPESDPNVAELGYWLGRQHWGIGIATEAARTVVGYGFQTLGLQRITSGYFQDNPRSGRVLSKLGFVETGCAERPCCAVGSVVPSVELSLPADPKS